MTETPRGPAIEAEQLEKTFVDPQRGEVHALRGVTMRAEYGEIYGLLGPNGAGKTTTMRILSTILAPTAGRARVAGIDVVADPLEARRRIGFLSNNTGLYPRLTARETLRYFGRLHGLEKDALEARIEELVDAFGMRDFADGRVEAFSTGQKQKVSIARTPGISIPPPADSSSFRSLASRSFCSRTSSTSFAARRKLAFCAASCAFSDSNFSRYCVSWSRLALRPLILLVCAR